VAVVSCGFVNVRRIHRPRVAQGLRSSTPGCSTFTERTGGSIARCLTAGPSAAFLIYGKCWFLFYRSR